MVIFVRNADVIWIREKNVTAKRTLKEWSWMDCSGTHKETVKDYKDTSLSEIHDVEGFLLRKLWKASK